MSFVRVFDAAEVEDPFELPGLTEEVLIDALRAGEALRAEATLLDAPTRGGSGAYFEKVRSLRVQLIPHGWTYSNARGFCTVISPDGGHAIAVATGTEGTGDVRRTPETARAMGPATAERIATNVVQLGLFDVDGDAPVQPLTWLLLSHRARHREGDRIFAELSLPDGRTEAGVVCTWRQRFVFEPFDLAPRPFDVEETNELPADADVEVALRG
jgi:hypothetical protein